jgi:dolichyl-phosphate beta-glucosyltransferase
VVAPDGWNLAWTSAIPGPALVAWPLTAAFGPAAAYDALALAAPALSAWCTYLLCRELRTGTAAALAGGLVFGFGTYAAVQTLNHVNLALVFTLPLAALVVARHLHGTLSDRRFVALFALCVAGVLATFLETLFWATIGALIALAAGLALTRGRERALLLRCAVLGGAAYALALLVLSPYLWVALAHPDPLGISGRGFELDLANLLVPTEVTALRPEPLHELARQLGGNNLTEQLGYVGPVLPALAGFALWERRRQPLARVLALAVLAGTLLALGSRLVVAGHRTPVQLPWGLLDDLPLASHALPARAFVLVWLALAVVVALFLARGGRWRWAAFALVAVTLAPSLEEARWATRLDRPALFAQDRWRAVVHPGENALVIPMGYQGQAMLWQQQAGFGFRMTGGYVSATVPEPLARHAFVRALYGAPLPPFPERELRALARDRQVDVVLLREGFPGPWEGILRATYGAPRAGGGMLAWRLRGAWPRSLDG